MKANAQNQMIQKRRPASVLVSLIAKQASTMAGGLMNGNSARYMTRITRLVRGISVGSNHQNVATKRNACHPITLPAFGTRWFNRNNIRGLVPKPQ